MPARRMALRQLLLTLCVVGSAADNATTTTAAAGDTTAAATSTAAAGDTTMASNTTGAPTTGTTVLSGTLTFTTASAAQCAEMQTTNGTLAMREVIKDASGVSSTDDCTAQVDCSTRRRLSDGRRLAGPKATVAYTVTIPPGSSATAVATVTSKLSGMTPTQWSNSIQTQMTAKGITVAVSGLTASQVASTT